MDRKYIFWKSLKNEKWYYTFQKITNPHCCSSHPEDQFYAPNNARRSWASAARRDRPSTMPKNDFHRPFHTARCSTPADRPYHTSLAYPKRTLYWKSPDNPDRISVTKRKAWKNPPCPPSRSFQNRSDYSETACSPYHNPVADRTYATERFDNRWRKIKSARRRHILSMKYPATEKTAFHPQYDR